RRLAADPAVARVLERLERTIRDPVELARQMLKELAPKCARTVLAVAHGDVAEMAPYITPVRVRLEASLQALNRAGLKEGITIEHEPSDKLKALARNWPELFAPKPLPSDPGEPSRRRIPDRNPPGA